MIYEKYEDGLSMEQFKCVREVSRYNRNYYVGFDGDLLFALSDDDNTTTWYVVEANEFRCIGVSYCTEDERLHRFQGVPT